MKTHRQGARGETTITKKIMKYSNGLYKLHPIEDDCVSLFEDKAPNFCKFRFDFIDPLVDQRGPTIRSSWKNNLDDKKESLGIACFGIVKSINFIRINKDKICIGDPEQRFKNIQYHNVLVFECIRAISELIYALRFENKLERTDPIFLISKYFNFLPLLITKKDMIEYKNKSKKLREYRNYYTHIPSFDLFGFEKNNPLIIKREKLEKVKRWSKINELIKTNPEYFDEAKKILSNDFDDLIILIDDIFISFYSRLEEIKKWP